MERMFTDANKIKIYARLQDELCKLNENSNDESINKIINLIPANYLNQKDELKIICSMFAFYARCHLSTMTKNTFRLFQRILSPIKTHLQDESAFFWNISGGLFYLKLFMHQEGLISIDQIILCLNADESSVVEYFYPEILDQAPEIFENETKYKLNFPINSEIIENFKAHRQKHIKWLMTSGDYKDPMYREIEQNSLRLAIKTDDVDSFQKILTNSNISINSKIKESTIENYFTYPHEVSLLEYVAKHNANDIFKFLVMQNVEINTEIIYIGAIQNNNYEMIHFFEQKIEKKFQQKLLSCSISLWNDEIIEYAMSNYNNDIFEKNEVNEENTHILIDIIAQTMNSHNYIFFESTILPFLKQNSLFFDQHIYDILYNSFYDLTFYFSKEFFSYPELDVNQHQKTKEGNNVSLLGLATQIGNITAVEKLLNHQNIQINKPAFNNYTPLQIACKKNIDIRIVKMICNHPKFDINFILNYSYDSIINICTVNGNFLALKYILDKFPYLQIKELNFCFYICIKYHYYTSLKIIVKYLFKNYEDLTCEELVESFDEEFQDENDYNVESVNELRQLINKFIS